MSSENVKYFEPNEEVVELFDEVLNDGKLSEVLRFKILSIQNFKNSDVIQVKKATDLIKVLAKGEAVDIVFLVNEWLLDVIQDNKLKKMIIEEAITSIVFDFEKGSISVSKPDFSSFFGVVKKYGNEVLLNTKELIKLQVEAKIQEEKDAKETKKAERSAKKKKY